MKKSKMTIEEFLTELSKTPRNWTIDDTGRLVFGEGDVCPVSAVAGFLFRGEPDDEGLDMNGANELGLSKSDARKIIAASDVGKTSRLRRSLETACLGEMICDPDDKSDSIYEDEFDDDF